ncbi:hypothetical protein HYQ46_007583 [Verticillium longisporum]|nr:hypothetical protein HYQ46_007583 [Verticillium longisporum]
MGDQYVEGDEEQDDEDNRLDDEDGVRRSLPVLPLFSASYLDSLPIYNITHAIRVVVQARTETSLTWEQLRSPQVSQFLVKPMQQQILPQGEPTVSGKRRHEHHARQGLRAAGRQAAQGVQHARTD